jgi:tRNA nucleotidyltransferase (CCA-adding enzyme)
VEQSVEQFDSLLVRTLAGGRIYAVGGRVRDEFLAEIGRPQEGIPNLDYLVTGLPLEEVIRRLGAVGKAELVGASFGVIKFVADGRIADVALPRRERAIGPRHRDFEVEASPEIPLEEDLARRDFRMNMMARDLSTGELIDPYDGRADLLNSRLDALRDEAFVEDPLRVLRGAQFVARFELAPSPGTLAGMRSAAERIASVAPERIAEELTKLLVKAKRPSLGFELLREVSALPSVLPELLEGWNVEQNEFHKYSVYEHSLVCCDAAPPTLVLRLAALLHDVGKPRTKEGPHFYRHEFVGEEMARSALTRLRFPNDLVDRVCRLIANHMYNSDEGLTDAAIRRFIRRVGKDRVEEMFALRHADVEASGLPPRDPEQQERFEHRVRAQIAAAPPFGIKDLLIDGTGVKAIMAELGLVGPAFEGDSRVGAVLRYCLEQVLDDPRKNEAAALREIAHRFFTSGR